MKKNLFPFVLIGISAILIYGGALDIFFYYDDFEWLDKVRNLGQKPLSIFVPVVHPPTSYLTPVTYIVFWLNFKLFGLNPFGYHLFNLILHIINSYLVVYLIFLLRGNLSLAALAGLFFAINFAITDAVIWPSAYVDTVMFFFYMLSLVTFVHFLAKKKNHYYPLSVFFFLLSLSAKGTALTLPIALFIVEKYCAYSKTGTKRLLKYIPFLLIALSYLFLLQYKSISGDVILSHVNIERVFLNILKVPLTLFFPEGLLPANFWWIFLYMLFFLIFALVEIKKDTSGMVRFGGLLTLTGILPLFPIEWKFLANPDPLTESIRHRLYLGKLWNSNIPWRNSL